MTLTIIQPTTSSRKIIVKGDFRFQISDLSYGLPPFGRVPDFGLRRDRELQYRISNKEFRTAEVFKKDKAMFFTSIFCGSLFCGSAVHILKDLIADS